MKKSTITTIALGAIAAISLTSCEYENTYHEVKSSQYSDKVKRQSNAIAVASTGRPLAKLPVRLGVARVYKNKDQSLYLPNGAKFESESDIATLHQLHGVSGALMLNSVLGGQTFSNVTELRKVARNYGIEVLGLYHLDTNTHHKDYSTIVSVATLGTAPTQGIRTVTTGTFSIIDAHSGYLYGVTNAIAKNKSIATGWGYSNAEKEDRLEMEEEVYQSILEKLPSSWNNASRQMR